MWPFDRVKRDPRSGRLVFLIECLMNQNARDLGAANQPAFTREVMDLLLEEGIGMVQIPCPEIACLGFERRRPPGRSIRQALEAPEPTACCRRLAETTAERIQCYIGQGYEVSAVLGGNERSPGCAVHGTEDEATRLAGHSGVFMLALAEELERRGIDIPFRGMRDVDPAQLELDLAWLRERFKR